MKALIVCSGNNNKIAPFISDQVEALNNLGIETVYFLIKGNGFRGYLNNLKPLIKAIQQENPDLIHAHYGLSGLFATLQTNIPVVTTYHGTDINNKKIRIFSQIAAYRSSYNIFVSENLADKIKSNKKAIIPCGVDTSLFFPQDKDEAKKALGLDKDKKYILFSSAFKNTIKNYPLAKSSIEILNDDNIKLLELKGYTRSQVSQLINASDLALLTSYSEGSPQFVKEAMACNCPVVSVDVGDVKHLLSGVTNSYIALNTADDLASKIKSVLTQKNNSNGRLKIFDLSLDANSVSESIIQIYHHGIKH
jgi:glycosyltransferase involved in cell wall biosynthesis